MKNQNKEKKCRKDETMIKIVQVKTVENNV